MRRRYVLRISVRIVPLSEFLAELRSPFGIEALGGEPPSPVLVDLDERGAPSVGPDDLAAVRAWPAPIIGVGSPAPSPAAALFDLVIEPGDPSLGGIVDRASRFPLASTAACLLLRNPTEPTGAGLVAESATYSALQAGPEFAAWRSAHAPRTTAISTSPPVRVVRRAADLEIVLSRPQRRNALDVTMRDALVEALGLAIADPDIGTVTVRGDGPAFCSGGDLDEFGTRLDPASAHLTRLLRSPARLLDRLRARTVVRVHGATRGSGIELAAFAGTVTAAPDTTVALPELALGLVPGAGGTVSLPRRIGRHRTAWLVLSGAVIDADTALAWGLVDEIVER